MNFVGNALRYTVQGSIVVACRQRGDMVLIQVWDTGLGIAAEHLDDVFREYVQIGNPERNRAKGLGLGLAICDRLSRLLGLKITVRSVLGRGSVFAIAVPLGEAHAPVPPETPAVVSSSQIGGTVVVLEDDAMAAAGMIELIAGWGCTVIGAPSAAEAMALCEYNGEAPDMVIASGFTIPFPAMSGALPWTASNTAYSSPILAPGTTPSPPTRPAPRSEMMSPYRFIMMLAL